MRALLGILLLVAAAAAATTFRLDGADPEGLVCVPLLREDTQAAVGTACVSIGPTAFNVSVTVTACMPVSVRVWVGLSQDAAPVQRLYPFKVTAPPCREKVWFLIPLSSLECDTLCDQLVWFSVRADIVCPASCELVPKACDESSMDCVSAWGNGCQFFSVHVLCDVQQDHCETAFAKGGASSTCFLDIGTLKANRWGWTNRLRAPPCSYSFVIWAGAGRCKTSSATAVGTLRVSYASGGTVTLQYVMSAGYGLQETHAYVGVNFLPLGQNGEPTVAPGQYPLSHESLGGALTDKFTVHDPSCTGQIYVIAHAVVCGGKLRGEPVEN
eukprot:TRINITY_DN2281_c1_g1_i1.p1 TRINITY_DN2281_c1_g1~~TRINITY_DN2281_c1_g1_i1.p1  ORF type:complete len:327 (+),score=55.02 TRINITY_DN2281_c1_g1_i1:437-1417(+)